MKRPVLSIVTASIVGGIAALPTTSLAMNQCGDRDHVIASLAEKHAERHIASGFQSEAGLMEIWASDADSSWTILLTRPDGVTCVMAHGTHWLESTMIPVSGDPA